MIPGSFGQGFQFPHRPVRLSQPQPKFRAPDLMEVGERELAVSGGWSGLSLIGMLTDWRGFSNEATISNLALLANAGLSCGLG